MVLNSLNAIIDDILLEIRNANIAESEDISRVQIEQWIHQYRALLIKQDLDKGRTVNPGYVQVINPFAMTLTNPTDTEKYIYESVNELPKTIDLHYGSGMITIRDTSGRLIQLGNESKAWVQGYRPFTKNDYIAYIKGNKLYAMKWLTNACETTDHTLDTLTNLEVSILAEDPTSVGKINGDCYDPDNTVYPVPANMIQTIKQLIFAKELYVMLASNTDVTNDAHNDTQNTPMTKNLANALTE